MSRPRDDKIDGGAANEDFEARKESVTCNMTAEIFLEPVFWIDAGRTIEKEFLENLIRRAEASNTPLQNPWNRQPASGAYKLNHAMVSDVDSFLRRHPECKNEQYKKSSPSQNSSQSAIARRPVASSNASSAVRAPDPQFNEQLSNAADTNELHRQQQAILDQGQRALQQRQPVQAAQHARFFENKDENISLPVALAIVPDSLDPQKPSTYKCLMLGQSNSGKSRFLVNLTNEGGASNFPSIGIDFKTLKFGENTVNVWDTAGQERFRTITGNYIRGTNLFLIFDDPEHHAARFTQNLPEGTQFYTLHYNSNSPSLLPSDSRLTLVGMPTPPPNNTPPPSTSPANAKAWGEAIVQAALSELRTVNQHRPPRR